ncbi:hypothetical protein T484DRAFT_2965077 [Baffinella frigidus]|nr:hypothetical protein T484DRAFT_2965077 [Cryptophyta sp. CCMP2293]
MTMRGALIAAVLLCGLLEAGSERPVHQLGPRQGAEGGATGGTTALLRQLASQPGGSQLRLRGGIMVYGQEADGNGGLHKNKPSGPKAPKAPKEEGANAPGKEVPVPSPFLAPSAFLGRLQSPKPRTLTPMGTLNPRA